MQDYLSITPLLARTAPQLSSKLVCLSQAEGPECCIFKLEWKYYLDVSEASSFNKAQLSLADDAIHLTIKPNQTPTSRVVIKIPVGTLMPNVTTVSSRFTIMHGDADCGDQRGPTPPGDLTFVSRIGDIRRGDCRQSQCAQDVYKD